MTRAFQLSLVFVVAVVSACSHAQARILSDPPPVPAGAGKAWYASNLPFTALNQEIYDLNQAFGVRLQRNITSCMTAAGFEYESQNPQEVVLPFTRYGLFDGDELRYREDDKDSSTTQSFNGATSTGQTPAYTIALFGSVVNENPRVPVKDDRGRSVGFTVETAGCLGDAEDAIFGSQERYAAYAGDIMVVQTLLSEADTNFFSSSSAMKLIDPWRACLQSRGVPRVERLDGLYTLEWSEDSVGEQRNAATAELDCKTRTHVVDQLFKLDWQMQSEFINRNGPSLQNLASWRTVLGVGVP